MSEINSKYREIVESEYCMKYCPHGGVCVLNPKHEGLHSTRSPLKEIEYCEWTDEECISKQEADLLIMATSPLSNELTQFILDLS